MDQLVVFQPSGFSYLSGSHFPRIPSSCSLFFFGTLKSLNMLQASMSREAEPWKLSEIAWRIRIILEGKA